MTSPLPFEISKPRYAKIQNNSGSHDPCYKFTITTQSPITMVLEQFPSTNELLIEDILKNNTTYLVSLLTVFLSSSSQYFAKPYSVDTIQRHVNHSVIDKTGSRTADISYELQCIPVEIVIYKGKFTFTWEITYEPIIIRIPDLEDTPTNQTEASENTKENAVLTTNATASSTAPVAATAATGTDDLIQVDDIEEDLRQGEHPSRDISRHYEKNRVKEAQLRAKLAVYKAERIMTQYIERFGSDMSDSEWSDSSDDSSDDDTTE